METSKRGSETYWLSIWEVACVAYSNVLNCWQIKEELNGNKMPIDNIEFAGMGQMKRECVSPEFI